MPARILLAAAVLCSSPASSMAQGPTVDAWRYTLHAPAEGWQQPAFVDRDWKEGEGGFGTRRTPGARVGTVWQSDNIWLRKSFTLPTVPKRPALLIHHDEDAEVYLNGQRVADFEGWTTAYDVVPIAKDQFGALKTGTNVLAVHCRQTNGGQFIDVHVVDADNVPKLPSAKRNTEPFASELITTWGQAVTPDNAWTEYPRPQLVRDDWQNLNGLWDYAITSVDRKKTPAKWEGKILVPYSLESRLGGVRRLLGATEALWYHRSFNASTSTGHRLLLNFEAVDYRCEVFVNGRSVGTHQGGNTPFSLDLTDVVRDGDNELVVRVEDATEGWQLRGKQVLEPDGIWYTQVSGIWQTVWLEQVGSSYLEDVTITTAADRGTITFRPELAGDARTGTVRVVVKDGDQAVAEVQSDAQQFSVNIANAKLWTPAEPHLYDLEITLLDGNGGVLDRVESYTGIRSVGTARDRDGHRRFTLNGQEIFHWGTLDQGWWPDGLLTPPSDKAMSFDIKLLKAAGFNTIRKHIKVEPRRYYFHCDRLGMMVWQDQVSGGRNPDWTRLAPKPKDADWPAEQHAQFMAEFERMVDTLENHPSIVVWVAFNEAWGQHRTIEVGKWLAARDATRLVNIASGGNFWPVGDIVDQHNYPQPDFPFDAERFKDHVKVIGEFGGHGYPVEGHVWDANRHNWGYGGLPRNKAEYEARYRKSFELLNDLRRRGIAAGIYTQTTDVEGEINGLMTYDRKAIKIPARQLAHLHRRLFEPIASEQKQ